MSNIDSELILLRQRLVFLEEQKRLELERESNPLNTLYNFINRLKRRVEKNRQTGRFLPTTSLADKETVDMLEPIYNALKQNQERLEILEKIMAVQNVKEN
jgi:hypothetical protein